MGRLGAQKEWKSKKRVIVCWDIFSTDNIHARTPVFIENIESSWIKGF